MIWNRLRSMKESLNQNNKHVEKTSSYFSYNLLSITEKITHTKCLVENT